MDWEWNRSFAQTPTAYWLNIGQKGFGGGGGGGGGWSSVSGICQEWALIFNFILNKF